jgi:hypothetical protein
MMRDEGCVSLLKVERFILLAFDFVASAGAHMGEFLAKFFSLEF